jgi:hypothetical protein
MRIGPIAAVREGAGASVAADISLGGRTDRIFFRANDAPLAESIEAFATVALLPCMAAGCDCVIDRPVSDRWLDGVGGIQTALPSLDSELSAVRLIGAVPRPTPGPAAPGVGAFFSGGVDSFYTVLGHLDEITHLVMVHGLDIPLGNRAMRRKVSETLRRVAGALEKEFVEVETNCRSLSDHYVDPHWTYGALLAAVSHVLSPVLGRMYVPSSGKVDAMDPWGSRPDLEPLWSTETLEVCIDGCGATRVEKTASVARSEIALGSLRVCWKVRRGSYNCGRCEKCLRTMVNLYAVGALERCPTFPARLNPRRLYQLKIRRPGAREYARQNLDALEAEGLDPRLCLALRRVVGGASGGKWRGNLRWLLDSCLWRLSLSR